MRLSQCCREVVDPEKRGVDLELLRTGSYAVRSGDALPGGEYRAIPESRRRTGTTRTEEGISPLRSRRPVGRMSAAGALVSADTTHRAYAKSRGVMSIMPVVFNKQCGIIPR